MFFAGFLNETSSKPVYFGMFIKPFLVLNIFAAGIVVGVLTQTEINGLPKLNLIKKTTNAQGEPVKAFPENGLVRTTAFCHLENEPGAIGNLNCLGTELKYWTEPRSAAADWSKYPVGTQFRIAGEPHIYEIDDYGSALVGTETIDIYKPTLEMMNDWGVRHVEIEIVKQGSFERSNEIMARRLQYPHVAEMYHRIEPMLARKNNFN